MPALFKINNDETAKNSTFSLIKESKFNPNNMEQQFQRKGDFKQ
jgi:hypothetical protein